MFIYILGLQSVFFSTDYSADNVSWLIYEFLYLQGKKNKKTKIVKNAGHIVIQYRGCIHTEFEKNGKVKLKKMSLHFVFINLYTVCWSLVSSVSASHLFSYLFSERSAQIIRSWLWSIPVSELGARTALVSGKSPRCPWFTAFISTEV